MFGACSCVWCACLCGVRVVCGFCVYMYGVCVSLCSVWLVCKFFGVCFMVCVICVFGV